MKQLIIIQAILIVLTTSCKKDSFITGSDAQITLSADTLHFDTIFTSAGSVTQSFKINNINNRKLQISSIILKGGASSPFKINVDGIAGPDVSNIEIEANDSIYVFVSVALNTNSVKLPFLVQDSVEIAYNGNKRYLQLDTWGQNANFFRAVKIRGRATWTNNLPYVIIGGVQVDTNAVLTIEKGCKIYLHADAPFLVDGTLLVNGEKQDSTRVHFMGDRLDEPYSQYPAAWPGIYFRGTSKNNILNYAIIRNAYQGLVSEQPAANANPKLTLNQCIVDNAYDAGVLGVQTSIQASNCLISNCGKNIQLVYGGSYRFNHCTVAAYSNNYIPHKEPVLFAANHIRQDNRFITADITAQFTNCIFWGEGGIVENEAVISRQGNSVFSINFDHCLWKVKTQPADITASNMINGPEPAFDSINVQKRYYDFRLKSNSPALNKGVNTTTRTDLDGLPRPTGLPDLGAYERQ